MKKNYNNLNRRGTEKISESEQAKGRKGTKGRDRWVRREWNVLIRGFVGTFFAVTLVLPRVWFSLLTSDKTDAMVLG